MNADHVSSWTWIIHTLYCSSVSHRLTQLFAVRKRIVASYESICKTMEEGWCHHSGYQPVMFWRNNLVLYSVLEKSCHTACMKGNNYLLEFLQGLVQFGIIIQGFRVINAGIMLTSIWYASFSFSRIRQRTRYIWEKKVSSIVQCYCSSHCWLW